jgi:hypothetical protein
MAFPPTSQIEDPGLIVYPGYINENTTLWVQNVSQYTGNFVAQASSSQNLQTIQNTAQTIALPLSTATSDPTLFEIVELLPGQPVLRCIQSGLYNITSAYGVLCRALPPQANYTVIQGNVSVYDVDNTTLLANFKGISNVQLNPGSGIYMLNMFGTFPIYAGQFVRLTYQDVTTYVGGNLSSTAFNSDPSILYPANPFVSLTLLGSLGNLQSVQARQRALTIAKPITKRGRYNLL